MKQLFRFWIAAALLIVAGCVEEYDDSALVGRVDDLESRVQRLEQLCQQMNTNISSLQTIVTALQNNDYVTGVTPITENGKTIGYTITFAKAQSITIYHGKDGQNGADGKDGQDGADGKDGYTPIIGVRQDTDGIYYWTLDGEWQLDASGNKIPITGKDGADGKDGITPQLKIEDGYWYVSYDNGVSWVVVGQATGDQGPQGEQGPQGDQGPQGNPGKDGDSFFQSVTQDNEFVYFTLADGTIISLPKRISLAIEFDSDDLVVMQTNSSRDIRYTVTSILPDVEVEVISSADIKAKVISDDSYSGVIRVKTGDEIDEYSKVVVLVSNGEKVIMKTLEFEEEAIEVVDEAKVTAKAEGGEVELLYLSNVECKVVIPEDVQSWISVVPATRAMERQTITLKLEPNDGASRSAEVQVKSIDGKLSLTYIIEQEPNLDYQLALEREALIAIYNALDGDNWTTNDNWCSDKPVSEWRGIFTDYLGRITYLSLNFGDSKGELPSVISCFSALEDLHIWSNIYESGNGEWEAVNKTRLPEDIFKIETLKSLSVCGFSIDINSIQSNISTLKNLTDLDLRYNNLSTNNFDVIAQLTNLKHLGISCNNLNGHIPSSIANLSNLEDLDLSQNNLTGNIPNEICRLNKLTSLNLAGNKLSGEIPINIGELSNLKHLDLKVNRLSGNIPASLAKLLKIETLELSSNLLSGTIPADIIEMPNWDYHCWYCIYENAFKDNGLHAIKTPKFSVECTDNTIFDSEVEFKKNKYTILHQSSLYINNVFLDGIKDIYNKYNKLGIDILTWIQYDTADEESNTIKPRFSSYIKDNSIEWKCYFPTRTNNFFAPRDLVWARHYPILFVSPDAVVVDNTGKVVFYTIGEIEPLKIFIENIMNEEQSEHYISTDYSQDGNITTMQTATKGNGIDIVLMGDAYSDRQIADGTYKADMENLYNNLFTEEPYKSFKDHFNVYYVNAVSATEGYKYGNTALDGYFGDGTLVGGNDNAAFNYALKAISAEEMDEAMIIVAMNSDNYAGTCYMYYPTYTTSTYGSGPSVAYFPRGGDATTFAQFLHHEACGHGFAKLADEYAYEAMGAIPSDYVSEIQAQQNSWGWWKNVDFTSNPSATRWNHFINDTRYANEGLGAYEGGLTYWSGVWRPTENSIMRYNTDGFNAPSREAIYYRIHKLAYGDSWEYDYEDFVEWDARNRATSTPATRAMVYKPANYKPTHPPVIVNKSWKDAK